MNSVPLRLWYMKTWIPVGGAVWGRSRRCGFATGRVVLEVGFETNSLQLHQARSLCFVHVFESGLLPAPATAPPFVMSFYFLELLFISGQNKLLLEVTLVTVFYDSNKRVTHIP